MILRCTKKLLDVIKPDHLADAPGSDEDWYANLLLIERRKCLLMTHAGTMFTIFEPDVRAAGLRATGPFVTELIARELEREKLPAETFGELDAASVAVAKTARRKILGCINELAFCTELSVPRGGRLARADVADINQRLRRWILMPLGGTYPIELAEQWIGG